MTGSVPQVVSLVAVAIGALLFFVSLRYINLADTVDDVRRLGFAFPLMLVPSICWHLLRTWGWSVAFPDEARPSFTRLFRVRLAADAISFFTVRGITGEPLKVLLLYDRTAPAVTAAAIALERTAFAVMAIIVSGLISYFAVQRLAMPGGWDALFTLLSIGAVLALATLGVIARHRTGDYLGRFVARLGHMTGRHLESSRVIRFILDVEDVLLELLRGDQRRLIILTMLPVVCYFITAFEVWLVLWAVGEPIGITAALAIETFARVGSIASAAIPANIGALEASNAAPVAMLGLGGGGALALSRRVRAMLWAALGLVLYPRIKSQRPKPNSQLLPTSNAQERPTTDAQERPTTDAQERLTTGAQERLTTGAQERPTSNAQERPTSNAQERPTSNAQERPTTDAQERLTADAQEPPTTDAQGPPTSNAQGPPTSTSR